jgi:hypothetical protein
MNGISGHNKFHGLRKYQLVDFLTMELIAQKYEN